MFKKTIFVWGSIIKVGGGDRNMRKMNRKTFSIFVLGFFIILSMISTAFPVSVFADENNCNIIEESSNESPSTSVVTVSYDYEINVDKTVRIKGDTLWMEDANITIGGIVEFRIIVTNTGYYGLTMNRIFDYLPYGLEYIDGSSMIIEPNGLSYPKEPKGIHGNVQSVLLTWSNLGCIAPREHYVLTFSAIAEECGSFTNIGCANATYPVDPEDCDTANVTVTGCDTTLDIGVEKLVQHGSYGIFEKNITFNINEYDWVTYKLLVTVNDELESLTVKDMLANKLTYIPGSATVNGTPMDPDVSNQMLMWNFTNIPAHEQYEILFKATVQDCGDFHNKVFVTGTSLEGSAMNKSDAWVHVQGCSPPMTVEKYVKWNCNGTYLQFISFNINMVDWATYKIYVNTSQAFDTISIKDTIPEGLEYIPGYTFVNFTDMEPTICGNDYYWNFSNVPANEHYKLTFRVLIPLCDLFLNRVNVTGIIASSSYSLSSEATMDVYGCDITVPGDMNGDGRLNSADIRYLAMYLNGDPSYSPIYANGDVNSDGRVNSADVRYLAMYLVGDPGYSPLYP